MFINSDFSDLLRLLDANGVRYLVVGGYAVVQYAEPRYTRSGQEQPMNAKRWCYLLTGLLVIAILGSVSRTAFAQAITTRQTPDGTPVTGLIQWQKDGVPVATALGNQRRPQIVTDGAGGAIVLWEDFRPYWVPDMPADLYAQRVSADGQPLWQPDGVPVAVPGNQFMPQLISDGAGGAIATWLDDRTGQWQIYAQRISAAGALLWGMDGIRLTGGANELGSPMITSDQAEGAIITWADYGDRQGVWPIVRVQRLRADGALAWGTGGSTVTYPWRGQFAPQITSDGNGGAIVAWAGDCGIWSGLCVQRLHGDGALVWGRSGLLLSVSNLPGDPQIQLWPDGAGGATVVWVDIRHLNADIYAQRVTAQGSAAWPGGGVPVIIADGDQGDPLVIDDRQDGVIVSWYDARTEETKRGIYVQHLDTNGRAIWNPSGVPVTVWASSNLSETAKSSASSSYYYDYFYDMTGDGAGGALITWWGSMKVNNTTRLGGIWLQRVVAEGTKVWGSLGVLVQPDPDYKGVSAPRLLNDRRGGAIVVWEDNRRWYKTDEYDIYAQRVVEGAYRCYLPMMNR